MIEKIVAFQIVRDGSDARVRCQCGSHSSMPAQHAGKLINGQYPFTCLSCGGIGYGYWRGSDSEKFSVVGEK